VHFVGLHYIIIPQCTNKKHMQYLFLTFIFNLYH